jgi:hypothetical protein
MEMKDRFDLEECVVNFDNFADSIDLVLQSLGDVPEEVTMNALIGISTMIRLHTQKTFDTMCQALRLDIYNEIPVDGVVPSSELTVTPCDDCECCDRTRGMDPVW